MKKNNSQKKQNFVLGALLLMISGIVCKLIGAFFKVPLTNMIGDAGMGYFSSAYSIYTVLFTISTAGIPVAVSRIISAYIVKKDKAAVTKTYKASMIILVALGLAGFLAMYIFAPELSKNFLNNEKAVYSVKALAPTLFFICFESALRGYFQGHQNMTPTAASQVIESVGKLLFGIIGAYYAMNKGYGIEYVSAFAIVGICIGAALSCVYLIICKLSYKKYDYGTPEPSLVSPSMSKVLSEIALIAIPITLSSLVLSIANLVDSTVIMRCLQNSGLTLENAKALIVNNENYVIEAMNGTEIIEAASNILYGNYTSLAVTMYNLPLVLLTPLSISIIPVLSEAFTKKDRAKINEVTDSAFRIQTAVSLPCALGLCALSYPALCVLYKSAPAKMAAPLLSLLSISIFFVAMVSVTNAMLHSLHKQWLPIISMSIGVAVKYISAYALISIPEIGIYGAPVSTLLCYLTAMIVNFYFLAKHTKCVPSIRRVFLRPFIASAICAVSALGSYYVLKTIMGEGRIVTLISIMFAAVVFFFALFLIGGLTKTDILFLPKGEKIYSLLLKLKIVKE